LTASSPASQGFIRLDGMMGGVDPFAGNWVLEPPIGSVTPKVEPSP
jgi:hypothetical protein